MKDFIIVYCTVPSREIALQIAEDLVGGRHAACVNIISDIASVYRWKGALQHDDELLLIIKTRKALYSTICERILALHPYEVPEIVSVDIAGGSDSYLQWIIESTNPE